jgi:multifunctional 2-oxoglutarate metabolism enzyme
MAIDTTTVEVVMPAMGDSVSEGTVLEWHKAEGDSVAADETLVEISTDKVDAEVPAPVDGTVVKVHAAEGDTIHVGSVLAEIAPTNGGPPAKAPDQVIDIVMPAMGESVSEGVVLEWAKQVGDSIEEDETIVEISTDKVDAEVPAPGSGTVAEILAQPG